MNGLFDVTTESLKRDLDLDVPEIYVVIAKHSVLGMPSESIRELLGCTAEELKEVEDEKDYKTIRQYMAGRQAQVSSNLTTGWDQIESMAVQNLVKRMPFEKDGEFLLRVAAVANKAQRRHQAQNNVLDPSTRNGRTVITLTQRLTQRLSNSGNQQVEETRQLSISDGSMSNPSFDEVDSLLSVSGRPILDKVTEIKTRNADPSLEELTRLILDEGD